MKKNTSGPPPPGAAKALLQLLFLLVRRYEWVLRGSAATSVDDYDDWADERQRTRSFLSGYLLLF